MRNITLVVPHLKFFCKRERALERFPIKLYTNIVMEILGAVGKRHSGPYFVILVGFPIF